MDWLNYLWAGICLGLEIIGSILVVMFNLTISFPYIFVPIIILSILGFIAKNFKRHRI